ncbi:MAG TPA: NAD(P)H-binding protein [Candidatus Limnocylindrales bacterium]|nr:NAD(P)H-binding protein [Candidatus Limnocylindrales bacterium]
MTHMAVTGALGFSGRHIATRLLAAGHDVVNLTNHPDRPDPFGGRLGVAPLIFEVDSLSASLAGVDTLFNTYWVRFARGDTDHALAARNSRVLFEAAARAGVRRIVHTSIANADPASGDSYYRGKAQVEAALAAAGPSYAVLRPAVLFGDEPILVNSIAWLLRHLPVFVIPGDGRYGIQPTHVEDLADVAVRLAAEDETTVTDVVGPERFTFGEFVRLIRDAVGSRTLLVHAPPMIALLGARVLTPIVRDVLITRQEIDGLTAGLLVSRDSPIGSRKFTDWLREAAPWLGRQYLSEVGRHFV